MKSIKELKFEPSKTLENTEEVEITLKNRYKVRILKGGKALHTYGAPYELRMTPLSDKICDEPVGYLNDEELISLINEIENLPTLKYN